MSSLLDTVVQQLHVLTLLGIASFLWFVGWRRYRLDLFRQHLFALRDELFDLAASGELPFNDRAYTGLRTQINAMIRFGHRLNSMQLLALSLFGPSIPEGIDNPYRQWRECLDRLDNGTLKNKLLDIHERVVFEMIAKVAFTSVFMLATCGVAICVMMCWFGASRAISLVACIGDKVPALTALEEELDLAA